VREEHEWERESASTWRDPKQQQQQQVQAYVRKNTNEAHDKIEKRQRKSSEKKTKAAEMNNNKIHTCWQKSEKPKNRIEHSKSKRKQNTNTVDFL